MSNAPTDQNGKHGIICASKADGITIIPIQANPVSHGLNIEIVTTGTNNGNNNNNAMTDENGVAVWTVLSSDGSGKIIEVYGDVSGGKVLTKVV